MLNISKPSGGSMVYVDSVFQAYSKVHSHKKKIIAEGHRWCHMWADDPEELHAMAQRMGLGRTWFHKHRRLDHYDVPASKRPLAVNCGAIEWNTLEWRRAKENAEKVQVSS